MGMSNCFGSNDSQINPHMRAKFGCSQTVVSKKWGGVQTDTHAHKGTYSRLVNKYQCGTSSSIQLRRVMAGCCLVSDIAFDIHCIRATVGVVEGKRRLWHVPCYPAEVSTGGLVQSFLF